MGAPDHMPENIEKAAEEARMERNRKMLIRELGLLEKKLLEIRGKPDAELNTREQVVKTMLINISPDDLARIPPVTRPDDEEWLFTLITEQDITDALNKRNRRQMKIQFGLVDEKLKEKGLNRETVTAEQLETAIKAVMDADLNQILAVERERTEKIMNEERARGHLPADFADESN